MTIFLAVIFCASFVYFYAKQQAEKSSATAEIEKKKELALPDAKLFNINSEILSDEQLRKGKVVLVFISPTCEACHIEAEFLRGVVGNRNDVKFYGVVSYGRQKEALESTQNRFPFEVFYDGDNLLALTLKVTKVPIKIYLENGVIKKVWGGASGNEKKKADFINWLASV